MAGGNDRSSVPDKAGRLNLNAVGSGPARVRARAREWEGPASVGRCVFLRQRPWELSEPRREPRRAPATRGRSAGRSRRGSEARGSGNGVARKGPGPRAVPRAKAPARPTQTFSRPRARTERISYTRRTPPRDLARPLRRRADFLLNVRYPHRENLVGANTERAPRDRPRSRPRQPRQPRPPPTPSVEGAAKDAYRRRSDSDDQTNFASW